MPRPPKITRKPKPRADLFSKAQLENIHRTTPEEFLTVLYKFVGPRGIALDPCSNAQSIVEARHAWRGPDAPCVDCGGQKRFADTCRRCGGSGVDIDGLTRSWEVPLLKGGIAYVNNPYTAAAHRRWIAKMNAEAALGAEIVCLTKAAPGNAWFQASAADLICFWRGRLVFGGLDQGAKFDSAVLYYGPQQRDFRYVFRDYGRVVNWGRP